MTPKQREQRAKLREEIEFCKTSVLTFKAQIRDKEMMVEARRKKVKTLLEEVQEIQQRAQEAPERIRRVEKKQAELEVKYAELGKDAQEVARAKRNQEGDRFGRLVLKLVEKNRVSDAMCVTAMSGGSVEMDEAWIKSLEQELGL